jgi:integrase
MAAVRLTETAISAAVRRATETGARIELADTGLPGLRLRVTPAGAKSWVLGCRDALGRARRFPLGEHPGLSISEARDAARAMRQAVKEGADPIAARRRTRAIGEAARQGEGTLKAVLDLYGVRRGAELRSWAHSRLRIERVFAAFLTSPVATMNAVDLQIAADGYRAPASAAFAVRTLRPVLRWAIQRNLAPAALAELRAPIPPKRRKRVLSRDELAALLPKLRASARPHAAALRFMLLTLARREEVCTARWADVDLAARTWTIGTTKNGEPHTVPLSDQAADVLRVIQVAGVPQKVKGRRKRGEESPKPLPPLPLKSEDLIFRTDRGTALGNWDRETKALQQASETGGWHRHDLRRTGATMLGDMGELPDIVEAALNHTAIHSPLAATYNRSRYRPQVAAALQRLADALDGIEKGSAEVVPLRRSAGRPTPAGRLPV